MNAVRTRIAPTPSGFLHLGNVYSFLLTAAIAEKAHAKLLLRIDDLDRPRVRVEYIQDIFDTLRFMSIPWQEGPADPVELEARFSQLHRLPLYNNVLRRLLSAGHLYACDCSRSELASHGAHGYPGICRHKNLPPDAPGVNLRLKTDARPLAIRQWNGPTLQTRLPPAMNDFVVRKKDGFPAYQLSSLTDDLFFQVDLVVRGEDLLDSTLAQLFLADVLGEKNFLDTVFFHHPLIKGKDGAKLSKSAGASSVRFLRENGYTREQVTGILPAFEDFGF